MNEDYTTPLDMIIVVWCNSDILYHHYTQHFIQQLTNNKIKVMLLVPEEVSDFIHPENHNIHVRKVSENDLTLGRNATGESDRTLSDLTPEELRSSQSIICLGQDLTLGRNATGESDRSLNDLQTNLQTETPLGVRALRLAMNEIHSTPSAYVWIGDWLCDDVDELYQMFVEKFAFDFDTETEMFDHFSMNPCIYYLEWETTNIPGSYWASCVALRSRYPIISGSRGRSPTYERKPFDFSISVSTAQLLAKKSTKSNSIKY